MRQRGNEAMRESAGMAFPSVPLCLVASLPISPFRATRRPPKKEFFKKHLVEIHAPVARFTPDSRNSPGLREAQRE